jgi:four helix bundle protein
MASFRAFTDIDAWQKARELAGLVYAVTRAGAFAKDFALRDQIRRASVSVMANIAEGFGRSGSSEFIQFLAVAKGSACEVISHVYVAFDQGYIDRSEFERLGDLGERTINLIGGLMKYLQQSNIKGAKYKRENERLVR